MSSCAHIAWLRIPGASECIRVCERGTIAVDSKLSAYGYDLLPSGTTYVYCAVEPSPPEVAAEACLATSGVFSLLCLRLRAVFANEDFPACARASTGEALAVEDSSSNAVRAACLKPADCLGLGDILCCCFGFEKSVCMRLRTAGICKQGQMDSSLVAVR